MTSLSGGHLIYLVPFLALYWLPVLIAFGRHARNRRWVLALTFFGGWTGLVWIIALLMAFGDREV